MKTIGFKLAAVAFTVCAAVSPAFAGKGGSASKIRQAVESTSVDAIIAEVERTEMLACDECVALVAGLTTDDRLAVREVAAWWFAKRPTLLKQFAVQFTAELASGDSTQVRNAADFLGRSSSFQALPELRAAMTRDVSGEAKLAIVRAISHFKSRQGNDVLVTAMADRNAPVRAAAALAWRDMREQVGAQPVVGLLGDSAAEVRAAAATTVGAMADQAGRAQLEALVVGDADAVVRRNAAWALGKLGSASSRGALLKATTDPSGLVRMTAKAALGLLK